MSDYPLSTKSSKKTKPPKQPTSLHSPLTERSVCQASRPQLLSKQIYGQLLVGEKVFLQLYYQGKVVQTAYPQYFVFMGAQLCKRLNPKVSIFITNLEQREMGPIKERVKKVCPNCRIVSILWFQQCYRAKHKVPFDGFQLDGEVETPEQRQAAQEADLGVFLADICEDMENEFKDFLRNDKNKYVQNLHKNHNKPLDEIIPIKDYDLGPNPQKKKRPKNDNGVKKRRKSVKPQSNRKTTGERQFKSMGRQGAQGEEGDADADGEAEAEAEEKQRQQQQATQKGPAQISISKVQVSSVQDVITKYLGMIKDQPVQDKELSIMSKRIPITQNNTDSKLPPSQNLPLRPPNSTILSKKSIQSSALQLKKNRESHRFTFSKVGSRYKDLHFKQEQPNAIDVVQLQSSILAISKGNENVLLVMTASQMVEKNLREISKQPTHHSAITFHIIKPHHFSAISQRVSQSADIFFLHNPKKPAERGLFFSLTLQKSPLKLYMVNYRLIDEVNAYNTQIRNAQLRTPLRLQRSRLKFIREIGYEVRDGSVKGKRVTFLNSELSCSVQQKAVQALGGEYIEKEDYLLNASVGVIVTDRVGWVQDKGALTVSEQAFWRQLIPLQGERQ